MTKNINSKKPPILCINKQYIKRETVYVKRNIVVLSRNHCCHWNNTFGYPRTATEYCVVTPTLQIYLSLHLKCPAFSVRFWTSLKFFVSFLKKSPIIKLFQIPLSGSDRQTDRYDEADRLKHMMVTSWEASLFPPVVPEQLLHSKVNHLLCDIAEFFFRIRNY